MSTAVRPQVVYARPLSPAYRIAVISLIALAVIAAALFVIFGSETVMTDLNSCASVLHGADHYEAAECPAARQARELQVWVPFGLAVWAAATAGVIWRAGNRP